MTAAARAMVRGSCPGALRPMESGDGLIVRVRPRAGSLSVAAVTALARAAARFGNGHIDLTRRANLQIRGVTPDALPGLQAAIDNLGLLDASPEAEAVRNIIVSPLAGIDPSEVLDVRPIALALERLIAADAGLWRLPTKFGFVVDSGGALSLADVRGDIRLAAAARGGIAIGIERPGGPIWLGQTTSDAAARAACRVAMAFLDMQPAGRRVRLRDAALSVETHIRSAIAPFIEPITDLALGSTLRSAGPAVNPLSSPRSWHSHASRHGVAVLRTDDGRRSTTPGQSDEETCVGPDLRRDDGDKCVTGSDEQSRVVLSVGPPIGELRCEGEIFAVGVAAPFGRVEADMLIGLADGAAKHGMCEIRVSPWRALYLPVSGEEKSAELLDIARRLGLVTNPDDPVLRIEACPGAPACSSASLDTRVAALTISQLLPRLDGIGRVHVSGCAKGCACSVAADLVLVGGQDRFGIVRGGRADAATESFILPRELDRLPALIARRGER